MGARGQHRRHAGDERQDGRAGHASVHAAEIEGRARLHLGGGDPLEEPAPRVEEAGQGPARRVGHQPCLMGQEDDRQGHLGHRQHETPGHVPQVGALGYAAPLGQDFRRHRDERRNGDGEQDELGPDERDAVGQSPAQEQGEVGGGRGERPAQVVEHLPPPDQIDAPARRSPARRPAQDPREELPVAPRPAMLPRRRDLVARGKLLEELDVADQPGPREQPLEQVVAEKRTFRHPAGERALEGVDIVDALAGVRALPEEVLVDVRHGGGIGVDARRTRRDPLVDRALAIRGHGGGDAGLKDPVALHHPTLARIQPGLVQRVGERSHQARRRAPGELGVGIERDHVADALGKGGRRGEEGGVGGAPQELIELVQLAPLALPAHPAPLARAPDAAAMEEVETGLTPGGGTVLEVERVDARPRRREQRVVPGSVLAGRVGPVREEGEPQLAIGVGEVVDPEAAGLLGDLPLVRQEGGHDHQGLQRGRHALGQLQTRQRAWGQQLHHRAVDESGRGVGGGKYRERGEHHE